MGILLESVVNVDVKLFGDKKLNPALAMVIFHSPLVLHWALVRWAPQKFRTIITLAIIVLMIIISLGLATSEFLMSYSRVMAILFAMQLIRLIMDPRPKFLTTVPLRTYLLSVMSFGPVALPGALADHSSTNLTKSDFAYDVMILSIKYAIVHAIHIFFYYFPYPIHPPVRQLTSVHWLPMATFYLLAVQLYMYMSVYFALSFGIYALVCGRRAPSIFHAPLLSASPRDFWSRRWNMLFKQVTHIVNKRGNTF